MVINARRVEGLMKERGFTQDSLSKKMGISLRTLSTFLNKGLITKEKHLEKLAEVLKVKPENLLAEDHKSISQTGSGQSVAIGSKNTYGMVETAQPKSVTEELKELADMKERGLLNEEEFAAAKRKVLGI